MLFRFQKLDKCQNFNIYLIYNFAVNFKESGRNGREAAVADGGEVETGRLFGLHEHEEEKGVRGGVEKAATGGRRGPEGGHCEASQTSCRDLLIYRPFPKTRGKTPGTRDKDEEAKEAEEESREEEEKEENFADGVEHK